MLPNSSVKPTKTMRNALKPALFLFVAVQALWLLWSGHYTPLLLGFGLLSTVGVVWICHKMGILDEDLVPFRLTWPTLRYLPWLTLQVIQSNLEVIRRVLLPTLRISPRVIKVRASQTTELGRVTYANSITLTPGTLTFDAEDDVLTVHAVGERTARALQEGAMDRRIKRIEDEAAK